MMALCAKKLDGTTPVKTLPNEENPFFVTSNISTTTDKQCLWNFLKKCYSISFTCFQQPKDVKEETKKSTQSLPV